jgi:CBS-domain-containing membrane protein
MNKKEVKDIMIDVFDYPHMPYWFSISQAIRIIKVSFLNVKKYLEPIAILVFDEKYNLLGTVTPKDILKGLEPEIVKRNSKAQVTEEPEIDSSIIWDNLFSKESKELTIKPVSEVMLPAKIFIEPDASVKKAVYLMLHHNLVLLPVLENKKKLVGIVRMIELFDEISNGIIENNNVLHSSKSEEGSD